MKATEKKGKKIVKSGLIHLIIRSLLDLIHSQLPESQGQDRFADLFHFIRDAKFYFAICHLVYLKLVQSIALTQFSIRLKHKDK